MSDEMTFDRQLNGWLRTDTPAMSPEIVDAALVSARTTRQRRGLLLAIAGPSPWPARRVSRSWPSLRAALLVALAVMALVATTIGGGALLNSVLLPPIGPSPTPAATPPIGPSPTPATTPPIGPSPTPMTTPAVSPSPSQSPPATPTSSLAVDLETLGTPTHQSSFPANAHDIPADTLITSSSFGMPITFTVGAYGGGQGSGTGLHGEPTNFCWAATSERVIRLPLLYACATELSILRPSAVECSTADASPDASELADALLLNAGLGATDLGDPLSDPQAASIPPGLLGDGPSSGRAVMISGQRQFSGGDENPDGCILRSADTVDEIRGDLSTLLVLLDVDGELVVIRSSAGHDRLSGAYADIRGYSGGASLESIHSISFAPLSSIPSASPAAQVGAPSIVVQNSNGERGPAYGTSHDAFAPGQRTGIALGIDIPSNAVGLRWSADGKKLAYFTRDAPDGQFSFDYTGAFIADADGSNPVALDVPRAMGEYTSNGWWSGVRWAPAGGLLGLEWDTGNCSDGPDCIPPTGIDVFDEQGALVLALDTPGAYGTGLQWSPDGSAIGWTSSECVDGSCTSVAFNWRTIEGPGAITSLDMPDSSVAWSLDNRLRVVPLDGSAGSYYSVAPDGSDRADVTWAEAPATAVWSPDGALLAAVDRESNTLLIHDADSGADTAINLPDALSIAGWSPENDRIVLFGEPSADANGDAYGLYVVKVDGLVGAQSLGDGEDFGWLPVSADPSKVNEN